MPSDAAAIASFIKYATHGQVALSRGDVMAAFGEKAYMLADYGGHLAAIAGWKVENLVARVDEMYVAPNAPLDKLAPPMLEAVEAASRDLQSEAALVFVTPLMAGAAAQALAGRGFAPTKPEQLPVAAWLEAARELRPPGAEMLFKKLRNDRVLRPIWRRPPRRRAIMSAITQWVKTHPRLTAWIVLAVGMNAMVIYEARTVGLLVGQWLALVVATTLVAGLCVWIIGWEDDAEDAEAEAVAKPPAETPPAAAKK